MNSQPKRSRLYYDAEFTLLSSKGRLISLAFVSEDERAFYAEFNDIEEQEFSPWIKSHVVSGLLYNRESDLFKEENSTLHIKDNSQKITDEFRRWIAPLGPVEIIADCPSFDWVFFCDLFETARELPETIFYIPFDLATLLWSRGMDPDMDRTGFVENHLGKETVSDLKQKANGRHNALFDAWILRHTIQILNSGKCNQTQKKD